MALRKVRPLTIRPTGLSDSEDGSNTFAGAMSSLQNLVPDPGDDKMWTCRPAAVKLTSFPGFITPGFVSCLLVIGDICYGMLSTGRNVGNDEPFVYNIKTNNFYTVSGVNAANTPISPSAVGDWVPPVMAAVGSKVIVTHPGFAGGASGYYFGWFDTTGFSDHPHTGTTVLASRTITGLSANVLQAGWTVGQIISDNFGDIPANTYIKAIAADGLSVALSATMTGGHAGNSLTVQGGTPTAPLWAAGNTNGNGLALVPVSVVQMGGRAYFAVNSGVVFSDSGNALQVTNASQVLVFANNAPVSALGPLPLSSPITGGIVQAVVAFQTTVALQIITGDASIAVGQTGSLAINILKAGTGTFSPNSIIPFTEGLVFVSPEGLRVVTFAATVTNPIGDHGTGVSVPFIFALTASRTVAVANADTLRITVKNGNDPNQTVQEYWLDLTRKVWSGPHTFPASLSQPWESTFLMTPVGITGSLWQSDATPAVGSVFVENGTPLTWIMQTVLLPDSETMSMHSIVEGSWMAKISSGLQVIATALDEGGSVLDTIYLNGPAGGQTLWGQFLWGQANWLGGTGFLRQHPLHWNIPIVWRQGSLRFTGMSQNNTEFGNIYINYQKLGYSLGYST